jgi:hypothetical protein
LEIEIKDTLNSRPKEFIEGGKNQQFQQELIYELKDSSKILTKEEDMVLIKKWIGKNNISFNLLTRASEDGF